jgi:NADH-dependent peroxiredoxin subunit F
MRHRDTVPSAPCHLRAARPEAGLPDGRLQQRHVPLAGSSSLAGSLPRRMPLLQTPDPSPDSSTETFAMLDANLKTQLKAYLEKAVRPIHITAHLDDSDASAELQSLLRDLKEVSDRISVTEQRGGERTPSFSLTSPGHDIHLTFAGLPMGHEFTSLVLALLQVGGHPSKLAQDLIEQIRSLDGEYRFETYFSLSCQNCPDVVQALNLMAVLNPNIQHVAIDGALFQQEVEQREVMSVPTIFLNGQVFGAGRMGVEEIVAKLDTNAGKREAEKIRARAPYDVLVVGGGPAGAA